MDGFTITKIRDKVFGIDDAQMNSFYLVEGEKLAAVIDTGVSEGKQIMPLIRELTHKPVVLLLTHAHIDHFYHMDEFDTVYMCHDEMAMPKAFLHAMMAGKKLDLDTTIHISTGSEIDLGGRVLEVCQVAGHTPGSVMFWDGLDDLLFSGDAIGSGLGVWMQIPSSTCLSVYRNSLTDFVLWAAQRSCSMEFLSGHRVQRAWSKRVPGDNPPSLGMVADMVVLVDRILNGSIEGEETELPSPSECKTALYAGWGRAEILYTAEKIH